MIMLRLNEVDDNSQYISAFKMEMQLRHVLSDVEFVSKKFVVDVFSNE